MAASSTKSLKKLGGNIDGDKAMAAIKGMKWTSPRGPVMIDPETRDIMQTVYIRKVEKKNGKLATSSSTRSPTSRTPASNAGRSRREAAVIGNVIGVLFDGIAYGSLLFIISSRPVGDDGPDELRQPRARRVRDGRRLRLRAADDAARACRSSRRCRSRSSPAAVVGIVLERTLYQRLYKSSHLDQVLFSIGLVFMSIADRDVFLRRVAAAGARCRRTCAGRCTCSALDFGVYRLFLIAVVAALTRRAAAAASSGRASARRCARAVDNAHGRGRPRHQRQSRVLR